MTIIFGRHRERGLSFISLPPPPTPSITSHPPSHSHPPWRTNLVGVPSSSAVTACVANGQSAHDGLKAGYLARASRETLGGVYTGDILASHCCATLLAWMHLPGLLAPGGSLHLLLPSLPVHRPLVHNRQWITHLSLNVPSRAHQPLHNDRIVALLLAPVPVPGQSLA